MTDLPTRLGPVVPVFAQRGKFVPTVGRQMPISLPGEIVMAKVLDVASNDVATVEIVGVVMGKSGHGLRTKDPVAVQRTIDDLGSEVWTPISEREVRMRETAARLAQAEADRRHAAVSEPVAEILPPKKRKR